VENNRQYSILPRSIDVNHSEAHLTGAKIDNQYVFPIIAHYAISALSLNLSVLSFYL
jgi:hypothetical protein